MGEEQTGTLASFLKKTNVPSFFHTGYSTLTTGYLPPLINILDDKIDTTVPLEYLRIFYNKIIWKGDLSPERLQQSIFIIESTAWLYTLCYFYIYYQYDACKDSTGLFKKVQNNDLDKKGFLTELRDAHDKVATCLFPKRPELLETVFSICVQYGRSILVDKYLRARIANDPQLKSTYYFSSHDEFFDYFIGGKAPSTVQGPPPPAPAHAAAAAPEPPAPPAVAGQGGTRKRMRLTRSKKVKRRASKKLRKL